MRIPMTGKILSKVEQQELLKSYEQVEETVEKAVRQRVGKMTEKLAGHFRVLFQKIC